VHLAGHPVPAALLSITTKPLRETSVSVIFRQLCFILVSMKTTDVAERSGKITTTLVTVSGLILVWTIVWANLPSKDELLSAQSALPIVEMPRSSELDLTIPGEPRRSVESSAGIEKAPPFTTVEGSSVPQDRRRRQIAEVKCEAEVQQYCPDSLEGEDLRRCVLQRFKRLEAPCQQIVRQRLVRWREADNYKSACVEDVKRVCPRVQPGGGRLLQCLQEHEQGLSETCYQSLPKGRLHLRN
jgi:hypothetical protein